MVRALPPSICCLAGNGRAMTTTRHRTLATWGAYEVETDGRDITAVHPFAKYPDPSTIGQSLKAVVQQTRVTGTSNRGVARWLLSGV